MPDEARDPEQETAETVSMRGPKPARRTLPRGALVGRYVVLGQLGEGGMGVVYKAYDPELERAVALKLLHPALESDESQASTRRDRLLREAKALARLSHPNVLAVFDVGTHEDDVFLATEFVEGATLRAWLAEAPRSRAEILRAFVAAGEGLAAAHRADLVHRDFKPTNVLVAADGRVRVLDFGLARSGSRDDPPIEPPPSSRSPPSTRLGTPLTEVGQILGTPRYMAPEQHLGGVVDARSDQFSYCVALYEALYGSPPFASKDGSYREAVLLGDVQPPPPGARVPRWLRTIVVRGLATSPETRWPSMDALLAELQRERTLARRRWVAGLVSVAVIGALTIGTMRARRADPPPLCAGAEKKLDGVWDDARRREVRAAFEASRLPYAGDAAREVETTLDGYARQWAAMHVDACEATRVRGEQSEELLDLRMECLEERRQELLALVDVFARPEPGTVENAAKAARALGRVDACADVAALRAPVRPPDDPAVRAKVDAVRTRIAGALALQRAGSYARALDVAGPAAAEAKSIGYRPLEADALFVLGDLQDDAGAYADAERSLEDALAAAIAGRHEAIAARALTALVAVTGLRQARYDRAHEWSNLATAAVERVNDPFVRGELPRNVGRLLYREGKYDASRERIEACLAIWEPALGAESLAVAGPLTDLGNVYFAEGDDARAALDYERPLAILEKTLGRDHPYLAPNLNNLAEVRERRGDYAEAITALERALSLWESALGPDHPKVALAAYNLSQALVDSGDAARARPLAERAVAIDEKALGPTHPDVAMVTVGLGEVLLALGEPARARGAFERALAIDDAGGDASDEDRAEALSGLGEALLAQRAARAAIGPLERALGLRERSTDTEPFDRGRTRFALARALLEAGGARGRARDLATKAKDDFGQAGRRGAERAAEVDAWLARAR